MNLDRGEYTENLTYDLNGNIGTLKRKGRQFPGYTAPENMDDLAYVYSGNRLTKVDDLSLNPSGYPIGGKAFGYDGNGNMTVQEDKGLSIAYNYLNLPQNIASPQGNTAYVYSADGTKVKKTAGSKVVDYLNGFQYENSTLQFFPTSEGYFDVVKNKYIYNYTDHLGNVRLSYMNSGSGVEIIEESNYYPFGLKHEGYNTSVGNAAYQYKYNGKELQETRMYDYGARMYMPDLGRWGVIDPLAETSRRWSTYTYAYNNPIRFIDPDGMQAEDKIKIFNNGNIERTKDNNAYDTITNEDESKSIQIARTNVTESNPTGDSQIGEAKDININTPGQIGEVGSDKYTYLQIQNDNAAKQFFEFAAENTGVEFTRDTFSFSDGFSSNVIGTSHLENVSVSAYKMIADRNLTGGNGFHIIGNAKSVINDHSHPMGQNLAPGGFESRFDKKTGAISFKRIITGSNVEDATFSARNPIYKSTNVYSTWKWPTSGKGYINYNEKTATYTGNIRK